MTLELLALFVSVPAFASFCIGIFCLFRYGLFAGDDHPAIWDHLQAAFLAVALVAAVAMIVAILVGL